MSTFALLACLPPGRANSETMTADLRPRMARYDRTRPVAAYRRPVTTTLTAFARQLAAIDDDVDLDGCDLPNRLTAWRFLAEYHNRHLTGDDERIYVDDHAQPYAISTINPEGTHDNWWIGGMWDARFPVLPLAHPGVLIEPRLSKNRWYCAGGVLQALDLGRMRLTARIAATDAYDRWDTVTRSTPPATPWSEFAQRHERAPQAYPLETAAADFTAQPRLRALLTHDRTADPAHRFAGLLHGYDELLDEFQAGRDTFITYHARQAVLGYALLTLDGTWLAPGQIARWASSTDTFADRLAYTEQATAHLDNLDLACRLVGVTCHG